MSVIAQTPGTGSCPLACMGTGAFLADGQRSAMVQERAFRFRPCDRLRTISRRAEKPRGPLRLFASFASESSTNTPVRLLASMSVIRAGWCRRCRGVKASAGCGVPESLRFKRTPSLTGLSGNRRPPCSRNSDEALPHAVAALTAHRERGTRCAPEDLVFGNRRGDPLRESKVLTNVLQPAAEAVGLGRVTWHRSRHIHSSLLNDLEVPTGTRKQRIRHDSLGRTASLRRRAS